MDRKITLSVLSSGSLRHEAGVNGRGDERESISFAGRRFGGCVYVPAIETSAFECGKSNFIPGVS